MTYNLTTALIVVVLPVLVIDPQLLLAQSYGIEYISSIPGITGTDNRIDIENNRAFITADSGRMYIVDICDPYNPSQTGIWSSSDVHIDIDVVGDYAYIMGRSTYRNRNLRIIHLTPPANPQLVGTVVLNTHHNPTNIKVINNIAVVAAVSSFRLVDVSDPTNPYEIASVHYYVSDVEWIDACGDYLYVVTSSGGFQVFDISNPFSPVRLSKLILPYYLCSILVRDTIAFLGCINYCYIIDISDLLNPYIVSECDVNCRWVRFMDADDYLLYSTGVRIIDCSSPTAPYVAASYAVDSQDISAEAGYLCVPESNRFLVLHCTVDTPVENYLDEGSKLSISLHSPAPNPFNQRSLVSFSLPKAVNISLKAYDLAGRLVETIAEGKYPPGSHTAALDGTRLSSGVYFISLEAGSQRDVKKLILLK